LILFDEVFDTLNSKNPFGRGSKAPVNQFTIQTVSERCDTFEDYVKGLKDMGGVPVLNKTIFTGFLGLMSGMKACVFMSKQLLFEEKRPLKYVLMYSISQVKISVFLFLN
jgi:hypothetical protein